MHKVTLRISSSGVGEVILDGKPLLVTGASIICNAHETPKVTFTLPADVDVEVETDAIDGPDLMELIRQSSR